VVLCRFWKKNDISLATPGFSSGFLDANLQIPVVLEPSVRFSFPQTRAMQKAKTAVL
jgi:hypothetical protein